MSTCRGRCGGERPLSRLKNPAAWFLLAGLLCLALFLMTPLAGCTDVNKTIRTRPSYGPTPPPSPKLTPLPTVTPEPEDTGGLVPVTTLPRTTTTPRPTIPEPTPRTFTTKDEVTLAFAYNRSAFEYNLTNPPLVIGWTLTVPNITRIRVDTNPVTGGDMTTTISYPDPSAWFEVIVTDTATGRTVAKDGYAGLYSSDYEREIWIRYSGIYHLEFAGNRVTATVRVREPGPV